MNLRKGEKTVSVSAIIDKRRLKRRFNPRYFCKIYVASKLASVFGFKVKFLNLVSVHHHDAGFFRVGGIDKHFLWHVLSLHNSASGAPGGASDLGSCLFWAISDAPHVWPAMATALRSISSTRIIAVFSDTQASSAVRIRLFAAIDLGPRQHLLVDYDPIGLLEV